MEYQYNSSITLVEGNKMQLKTFLEVQNIPCYLFAIKIGVGPSTVQSWLNGRKIPRSKNIKKIFEATKGAVCLQDWNDLRKKEGNLIEKE